jgi:predicted choloylglycine hydrolase
MGRLDLKVVKILLKIILGILIVLLAIIFVPYFFQQNMSFSIIHLDGSYYSIGYSEGQRAAQKQRLLRHVLKLPIFADVISERFNKITQLLSEYNPGLLDEMKGFSDAIGIPYPEVVVKMSLYGFKPIIPGACTQIALLPERTANRHMLIGRSYDFSDIRVLTDRRLVLLSPEGSLASIGTSQHFFGRYDGMNSAGLYVGMSAALGKGYQKEGFFFPMVVRILLDSCRFANEALQLIQKIPHSASYNYLIADAGNAYVVEVSPPKFAIRQAKKGLLIATNHYVSPSMKEEQKKVLPNSMFRYRTVEGLLGGSSKNDLSGLQKVLSGHHDEGVCVHHYMSFLGTLWSATYDLDTKEVYYALGAPCLNSYRRFGFPMEKKKDESVQGRLPANDWLFPKESKK